MDVSRFARPVVKALAKIGIQAEVSGRNDLTIDGKKFSGNAMALHKERLLYHGTLLFDSDLEILSQALNVSADKMESKGIKSVRSRVTNIKPYTTSEMPISQFKQILKQLLFESGTQATYEPTLEDQAAIQKLVETKYLTWEWNIGNNPPTTVKHANRYPGGKLEIYLDLDKGYLKSCQIRGDFLGLCDIDEVEQRLSNIRYVSEDIQSALEGLDLQKHFGSISKDEIVQCIMGT
jgi:lipoate-protein ligase A